MMAFSLSGSVITQSNEAAKAITAVASGGTDLLQFSVAAHGYAVGDLVWVTGTTSYNGAYLIDTINTNDFIVSDTNLAGVQNPFVATQTGTVEKGDADLSGLSSILASSRIVREANVTVYDVLDYEFVLEGTLAISINDGNLEALHAGSTDSILAYRSIWFDAKADSWLRVGNVNVDSQGNRYVTQNHTQLKISRPFTTVSPFAAGGSQALSDGVANDLVDENSVLSFRPGSEAYFLGANVELYGAWGTSASMVRFEVRDCRIGFHYGGNYWFKADDIRDNYIAKGSSIPALGVPEEFSGNVFAGTSSATGLLNSAVIGGSTSATNLTYKNFPAPRNRDAVNHTIRGGGIVSTIPEGKVFFLYNVETGGEHPAYSGSNAGRRIQVYLYQEVNVSLKDLDGLPIENARFFVKGYNGKTDKTALTQSDGTLASDIVVEIFYDDISTPSTFGSPTYYNKNGDDTADNYDVGFTSYNHAVLPLLDESFRGFSDVKIIDTVMLPDLQVTQMSKSIVEAYNAIETPQKWYDRDKSDLVDNFAGEVQTYTSRTGDVIEAGSANITLQSGTNANPIQQTLSGGLVTAETVYIGTGFTGTINTTGTVTDTGSPRTIAYGVTGGQLVINDASAPWTVDGNFTITDVINNDAANNLVVYRASDADVSTTEPGVGFGQVQIILTTSLTLTGLQPNSEVRIYEAGTLTEIDGVENSGTSFSTTISVSSVDIVVFALDYQPIKLKAVDTTSDVSLPIQQVTDRVYANP